MKHGQKNLVRQGARAVSRRKWTYWAIEDAGARRATTYDGILARAAGQAVRTEGQYTGCAPNLVWDQKLQMNQVLAPGAVPKQKRPQQSIGSEELGLSLW